MNMIVKKCLIAAVLAGASMGAQAATLMHTFEGRTVNLTIPAQYEDLRPHFTANPDFSRFWGTIVLPDYHNYQVGTHKIGLNTNGLQLSLESGFLLQIEGTRVRSTTPNPDYNPSLPSCASSRGCDLDGDGVRETPFGNLDRLRLGTTVLPDDTQVGSEGSVTIVDGVVTSFDWKAIGGDSPALAEFNRRLFVNAGFPVTIDLIDIDVVGSTPVHQVGNVFLSASLGGVANVTMVPLPAALPMMLSGLALLGSGGLRRRFIPKSFWVKAV